MMDGRAYTHTHTHTCAHAHPRARAHIAGFAASSFSRQLCQERFFVHVTRQRSSLRRATTRGCAERRRKIK